MANVVVRGVLLRVTRGVRRNGRIADKEGQTLIITEPTVLMPGMSAKLLSTGFVAVDLGYLADPIAFTDEVIASEKAALPGWRWRAEYEREWGAQAGQPVFDAEWLAVQQGNIRDPKARLRWRPKTHDFIEDEHGPIQIWAWPNEPPKNIPKLVMGQRRAVGMGLDVGEGVGKSDSTILGFWGDTREQVLEFASNTMRPTDLGRMAADLGRYYNDAVICPVRKMHGITVLRAILDEAGYGYLWRSEKHDRTSREKAETYGWPGGEASSPYLFGRWVDAIQHNRVTLRSLETLEQHRQYIYDEMGRITHQQRADLPAMVREKHGDLVIGCCLAWLACCDVPRLRAETPFNIYNPYTAQGQFNLAELEKSDDAKWDE